MCAKLLVPELRVDHIISQVDENHDDEIESASVASALHDENTLLPTQFPPAADPSRRMRVQTRVSLMSALQPRTSMSSCFLWTSYVHS